MSTQSRPNVDDYFVPLLLVQTWPICSVASIKSAIREYVSTRWSIRTTRWSTSLTVDFVEERLRTRYRPDQRREDREFARWIGSTTKLGVPETVYLTDEGDVIVDRHLPGHVRVGLLLLVLFAPLLLLFNYEGALFLYGSLGIVLALLLPTSTSRPLDDRQSRRIARKTTAVRGLGVLAAVSSVWAGVEFNSGLPIFALLFVAVLALQAVLMYLENALPGIETGIGETTLYIPLFGMAQSMMALVLFFVVEGFFSGLYMVADAWVEFFLPGYTFWKSSMYSDITGNRVMPGTGVDRELIISGFFTNVDGWIEILLLVVSLWYVLSILTAWRIKRNLLWNRLTGLGHYGRYMILIGTVLGNIVMLGGAVVAVDILSYGLLGRSFLPPSLYTPVVNTYVPQETVTGEIFLRGIYRSFEYTFRSAGFVAPRIFGILMTGILLWPFVLIISGAVSSTFIPRLRTGVLLLRSTPLSEYDVSSDISDDVHPMVVKWDGAVDVRPVALLFGLRKYVFVTEAVVEELGPDSLEAILRHEEYHLNNREYGIFATILALAVGGRNALLVFRDYPRIEERADAYAARKVGKTELLTAVRRLSNLKSHDDVPDGRINGSSPGFVSTPVGPSLTDSLSELARKGHGELSTFRRQFVRVLGVIDSILSANHELFFGATLYTSAHLTTRERIRRIEELDV